MKNISLLLLIVLIWSCKSQPKLASHLELSENHKIVFLDSLTAGDAITTDVKENFFAYVNKLDMSIQMKKNFSEEVTRESVLKEYKDFLKKDVLDFTKEEVEFVNKVFKEAYSLSNKVSPNIFPKEIKLIKTHANHYGNGAYYTRDNCIIIPKNELSRKDAKAFLEVMFHEISHIYTRYNTDKRKKLYGLIGFKNIGNPTNLLMKDALKERILLNPDGINYAYKIDLKKSNGRNYSAVPIIFSSETEFVESKNTFFRYLDFSLFEINIQHAANVISDENGKSTINMANVPDFFEQITDHTGYIIHPDEIIADNFMYIMMRGKEGGLQKNFSEAGLQLLKNIKSVLVE